MPNAVQTIAGFVTFAGAATTVVTPAPGDTFTVPSFDLSAKAYIENAWVSGGQVDFFRVRSPRLHDANQGLRVWNGLCLRRTILPWGNHEVLYPSDTPTVELDATGAGSNGIVLQYGYDDLPGVQPRLAMWADVESRIVHVMGCEVDVTSGAIGAWGNSSPLNSSFDNFEAGADYALLGYTMSVNCMAIAISGKDTGNLKIGGPGANDGFESTNYFVNWAERLGKPRIPIIAANNRGSTVLQNIDIAAATATKVSLYLAQLA